MSLEQLDPLANEVVELERIDTSCNMARFYALSRQPTLFGDMAVVREWGRIGTRGRYKIEFCNSSEEAMARLAGLEKAKRRRGYV